MNDYEKEKKYWKDLLEAQEIDRETYNKQIEKIDLRYNFNDTHKIKDKVKINKKKKILILIFFVCIIIFIYFKFLYIDESNYIVSDIGNLKDPIQNVTTGGTSKVISDIDVKIDYLASYIIEGRVVKTFSYVPLTMQNRISPKDVGLTWGFLAQDEYNNKIEWKASGNRFLNWRIEDGNWYREVIGESNFQEHVSNNHLIASNTEIENLIGKIKEGDYIKITGYLVNVHYERADGYKYYWNSSLSRKDTGEGACELIYVTDINWLK